MKKKWLISNVLVLLVVVSILVWIVWTFSFSDTVSPEEECIEVNKVASFVYNVCYDAYSKNIFLEAKRGIDAYKINSLKVSFFDFTEKSYAITDVPNTRDSKAYKIPADKKMDNIDISLDIDKDFSAPICEEPRNLFVTFCPPGDQQDNVSAFISPLEGVAIEDFIEINRSSRQDSDRFNIELVDKQRIWKSRCESKWDCGPWEKCDGSVQRRTCDDVNECFIPTDLPDTVQRCDGSCEEDWGCEWSACKDGFTSPSCDDSNNCGTSYDIPKKLACGDDSRCVPDIHCAEWSTCEVDYNFIDLAEEEINSLTGSKYRSCVDKNDCTDSQQEVRECSVGVDVYTKRFSKCGENFVGVYNRLDNDLLARISRGDDERPYLNINLDDGKDSFYCDYCFDGKMTGDEDGVDCGGSCKPCDDKYQEADYEKPTLWSKFGGWLKKMLT